MVGLLKLEQLRKLILMSTLPQIIITRHFCHEKQSEIQSVMLGEVSREIIHKELTIGQSYLPLTTL